MYIRMVDTDHSGTLDFVEFCELINVLQMEPSKQLPYIFKAFDINGDGEINLKELKEGCQLVGVQATDEELKKAF
jgi:Ca2+-binding EF-hand superfamily protein